MNTIREIERLNQRELDNVISPEASWHADYRDTAYVHIGGLPYEVTEGDILTIFSEFGEPTYLHLARDKESGKSKGFAWLKYEDQRSTDLAVDNLGGANVLGRTLKVDHTRYKRKDGEDEEEERARELRDEESEEEEEEDDAEKRPMLIEERELAKLIEEHDEEDPMKEYLVREKKEEVALAVAKWEKEKRREDKHRHKHHRRHHRHYKHGSRDVERREKRHRDEEGGREGDGGGRHRSRRDRSRSR